MADVDYQALLKKHGGTIVDSSAPASAPAVDYQALLKKHGGTIVQSSTSETPKSYEWSDVPGAALQNAPASAAKMVSGMAEAVAHPIQTAETLGLAAGGGIYNIAPESVRSMIDQFNNDPALTKRAVDTANAIGGVYKQNYGSVEGFKRALAEDPFAVAADAATLLGGVGGITGKVGTLPNVTKNAMLASKILNPVGTITAGVVGKGAEQVGKIRQGLSPLNATLMDITEGRAPEVINALRSAQPAVAGSPLTASQAASSLGLSRFSAAGRQAAEEMPTPFDQIAQQQRAAQIAAVQSVGKTPTELQSAIASRGATTSPLYKKATEGMVQESPELTAVLQNPVVADLLPNVEKSTVGAKQVFKTGETRPAGWVDTGRISPSGKPIMTFDPGESAQYSKYSLDILKKKLDKELTKPELSDGERIALTTAKNDLLDWMGKQGNMPEYGAARAKFGELSVPINQMQVGQHMEKLLVPALESNKPLHAEAYAQALRNQTDTLKAALDSSRFSKLKDVLTDDQVKALENVQKDLATIHEDIRLANVGAGEGQAIQKMASKKGEDIKAPNLLNAKAAVVNDILRRLKSKADKKLLAEFAQLMTSPEAAASAIEKASKWQTRGEMMAKPFQLIGGGMAVPLRQPTVINALSGVQQQQQNALAPQ